MVKIVNEELAALMGGASRDLAFAGSGPTVILMAGLQGSGKTTACAKLAKHLAKDGKRVALVACDTQRPAAVEQLVTMGKRAGAKVYEQGTERGPVEIAEWALGQAERRRRGRADHRHGRTPAHRRGADGRAGGDPKEHQARTTSSWCSTR